MQANESHLRAQIEAEFSEIYRAGNAMAEMEPEALGLAILEIRERCLNLGALKLQLEQIERPTNEQIVTKIRLAGQ